MDNFLGASEVFVPYRCMRNRWSVRTFKNLEFAPLPELTILRGLVGNYFKIISPAKLEQEFRTVGS